MPKEIWNEGRIVGLSAYEVYVKQHLSEDPLTPPATEREWLASSLAMGTSMLLKVPNVDQGAKEHKYVDIFLPINTKLAAANTIVAQFFDGDATFDGDWAVRVTDYGQLISNTEAASPSGAVGPQGTIPTQTLSEWSDTRKNQLKDYLRIYDGIVIQPGTWIDSEVKPPQKDFQANLGSVYPRIRLHVRGKISTNPLILLTGFTIRSVLAGVVGQDTVTESGSPQDGDFLGPAVFPWSAKIVFCVPSSYITYFESGGYERRLKTPTAEASSDTSKLIQDTAVIDMQATKPETFYNNYSSYYAKFTNDSTNPRYQYKVDEFQTLGDPPTDGEAVLTIYQKKAIYPPAMYGTFVGETGYHYLNPIDVVAPGTVKVFYNQSATVLKDYQNTFPGTTGMNRKADGTIQVLNSNGDIVDVAGLEINYISNNGTSFETPVSTLTGDNRPRMIRIKTGQKSVWALMMSTNIADGASTAPTAVTVSKKPSASTAITLTSANSDDNIAWSSLLEALRHNKPIDLLGTRLKSAKQSLVKARNAGPYLEFGPDNAPLRLYITDTAPSTAGVPEGSIGIGWGFQYEG